ncbi:MAG: oligosaccharide flippase family protein [Clostridia bacterium]|nr:oligosaccharide flippase family protein [Clostridia bacterium]
MKKVLFFKNAIIMAITSIALRTVGIFFRVWLSSAIGAEGIGLYQVIFSVYVLASTFATSGICTAVTRITASKLAVGDNQGALRCVKISVLLSSAIALFSMSVIILFARPISLYIIKDIRAENSIKILSLSLPFMGVCSCLRGYFLARRSTLPPSFCQIAEQVVRIPIIMFLVVKTAPYGLSASAASVIIGDVASEVVGATLLWLCYIGDKKRLAKGEKTKGGILKELLRIATPISAGRYLHTGLRTGENLLTPICLSKYCSDTSVGLGQFGMIKGMALPLLLFPASLLSSVSTLLVPEMTEAMEKNNKALIRSAIDKIFYTTSVFSFLIGGVFFVASGQIGQVFYKSREVGYLIRALSPLVPFMYIDLIADGILKGLDQQKVLLRNNVIDSLVRIILVVLLVPRFGMTGFLGVMLFSNLFTATLSVVRILKVTEMKLGLYKTMFAPFLSIFVASAIAQKLLRPFSHNLYLYISVSTAGISILYFILMVIMDGKELKKLFPQKLIKSRKV